MTAAQRVSQRHPISNTPTALPVTFLERPPTRPTSQASRYVMFICNNNFIFLDQLDAKRQARKDRSVDPTAAIVCLVRWQICASDHTWGATDMITASRWTSWFCGEMLINHPRHTKHQLLHTHARAFQAHVTPNVWRTLAKFQTEWR